MANSVISILDIPERTPGSNFKFLAVDKSTSNTSTVDIDDIKTYVSDTELTAKVDVVYSLANTNSNNVTLAYNKANTASNTAISAYNKANTAYDVAVAAYDTANNAGGVVDVSAAYNTANAAFVKANNAYDLANSSIEAVNSITASSSYYTFDTVANMVAENLTLGVRVRTLGYYGIGDGGDVLYEIVSANTGTNDGGNYINLNNGLQAKALFLGTKVRLTQFGAKGNYSSTSTALSLGDWTNPETGVFEWVWDGSSEYSPLTFSTVPGGSYIFSVFRTSAKGSVNYYDLQLKQGNGTSIENIATWARPVSTSTFTATQSYVSLLHIHDNTALSVKFKDVTLYRVDNDLNALNAALTFFGSSYGVLVIDKKSYFNITSSNITIPENVSLEFSNPGIMAFNTTNKKLIINSFIVADDRPIFPKYSSVTFSSRQKNINRYWFGV